MSRHGKIKVEWPFVISWAVMMGFWWVVSPRMWWQTCIFAACVVMMACEVVRRLRS